MAGWRVWFVGAVIGAEAVTLAVVLAAELPHASHAPPPAVTTSPADPVATATTGPPTLSRGEVAAEPSTDTLAAIATSANFSVSVRDVDSGVSLTYGKGLFDTASIVKVDILAALLWRHQEQGSTLSAAERSLAAAMITRSDNDATNTLFAAVGGELGLQAFNDSIGLTHTDVASGGAWGLTQTTAADQVGLLRFVLGDRSRLRRVARSYARSLMSAVIDDQRFGVSAAADDAAAAVLKVGRLQRPTTGLWDVTSIGEIEADQRTYWIAVLTGGNPTLEAGVELVERVARAGIAAMR